MPSTHTGLFAAATPWLGAFPGALLTEGVGVLIVLCSGGFDFKAKSLQMGTSLSMILLQVHPPASTACREYSGGTLTPQVIAHAALCSGLAAL